MDLDAVEHQSPPTAEEEDDPEWNDVDIEELKTENPVVMPLNQAPLQQPS
jgi:hypothetical protein